MTQMKYAECDACNGDIYYHEAWVVERKFHGNSVRMHQQCARKLGK